jgi:hypothetical protein
VAEQRPSSEPTLGPDDSAPPTNGRRAEERVGRLRSGLSDLDQSVPVVARERYLRWLGAVLMVTGPVWIAVEYFVSHSTRSPLQQGDATIGSLWGLALLILGVALFLRYSGGRLWRYGIARMTYDQDILSERVVAAVANSQRSPRGPLVASRAGDPSSPDDPVSDDTTLPADRAVGTD